MSDFTDHDRLVAAHDKLWREYRALKADATELAAQNKALRAKYDGDLVERMRAGIMATEAENAALRTALRTLYDLYSNLADADSDAFSSAWAAAVVALGRDGTDGD